MYKKIFLPVIMVTVLVTDIRGQENETKTDPRIDSVKSMMRAYVDAFNQKELEKVAALWAKDCSYVDRGTGERVEGRESMQADLKQVFDRQPHVKLAGTVDRVKLITDDVAQVEGETVMGSPELEPVRTLFSAILVKAGDGWQIHSLEESALPEPETPYDALKELEWMVGRWVDDGETATVDTRIRWSANAAFLVRSFTMHTDQGIAQEGTQVIGWDPRARQIRSWTFNSDGSFGEGFWSKSGNDWLIKSSQTLEDGRSASGTYVLEKANDDAIRLRLIGHTIDGAPRPASEAVTMMRVQAPEEASEKAGNEANKERKETPAPKASQPQKKPEPESKSSSRRGDRS